MTADPTDLCRAVTNGHWPPQDAFVRDNLDLCKKGSLIRTRAVEGAACTGGRHAAGFKRSMTNGDTGEKVAVFWSSVVFGPNRPATDCLPVDFEERRKFLSLEKA